jgi:Zn-dependent oligopeptidase
VDEICLYLYYRQSTLVAGDDRIARIAEPLIFYNNVAPTKEIRDASNDAEALLLDFGVECSMRLDVFKAKMAAKENAIASGQWEKLSPEQQRLADKMVGHF